MGRLVRILERAVDLSGYFCAGLVLIILVLIFIEVFSRYVARQPLRIGEEFSAYVLVALSYIGAAYVWKEKRHVRITAVVSRVSTRFANWLRVTTLASALILMIGLCQGAYSFVATSFNFQVASNTVFRIPLQVPHLTVLLGFVFLTIWITSELAVAIVKIRSGEIVDEVTISED